MQTKTSSWLNVAIGFQFLTAAIHSLSFLNKMKGQNEKEKQLIDLMDNYKLDWGSGFHRSMSEIFIAVSLCFTLIFLMGALINLYLTRKHASAELVKDIVGIQTLIFGAVFLGTVFFAFLPPIICAGIVFLLLTVSYFRLKTSK
ncbi:MAG: hypothetical protein QM734_08800 [Cyclobacteriaceae bacterium]